MKDSHSPFKAGFSDKSWLESPIHRMKCKKTPRLMSRAEYIPSIIHLSSSFVTRPRLPSSSSNLSRFLERSANNLCTAGLSSDVNNAVFSLNNVFDFSPEEKKQLKTSLINDQLSYLTILYSLPASFSRALSNAIFNPAKSILTDSS